MNALENKDLRDQIRAAYRDAQTMVKSGRARKAAVNETPEVLVDELGELKARIAAIEDQAAPLVKRAEEIRAALVATGLAEIDGSLYRATVSRAERHSLDTAGIKAAMPAEWISRFTKTATVVTLRVVARLAG